MKRIFSTLLALFLTGCISVTINMPGSPTRTPIALPADAASPLPSLTPDTVWPESLTPTADPNMAWPTPTPDPNITWPTPTMDLTLVPPPDSTPRALYFLAQNGVWALRPSVGKAVRLTAEDLIVTAFDVWPGSGKLAFATKSGKLYTQNPGKDAMLFLKLEDAPYPAYVNGIDWSPDGSKLAFTVAYDGGGDNVFAGYPSRPSGVWTAALDGSKPTWILSNLYPKSQETIANARIFSEPEWSPDGQALIVHAQYWEWSNTHWIYPLEYAEDDRNLHTLKIPNLPEADWDHAAWTADSQGLIFSSQNMVTFGDLAYASRDGAETRLIQSGQGANLYIANAHMVPADSFMPGGTLGIASGPGRMVYLGLCPNCGSKPITQLFILTPSLNGSIFWPEGICKQVDADGNTNQARSIEWNPDFSLGVLPCGYNEIYLLNTHRAEPILTDLLPALPDLSEREVPVFRWGEYGGR